MNMLQNLYVKNLALIDETEVEFGEGLNILTGETGAGKSLLLGSVHLALGGKYSPDMLRNGTKSGLVELTFKIEDEQIEKHLENGVAFTCTDGITITRDVEIGAGTEILPGTIIRGKTKIGANCVIGPNCLIENCEIKDGVRLNYVQAYQSVIEAGVKIGPFVHIRPNSHIMSGVKIGDFVEIKNSTIGENTAVAHLTYVGDSDVGKKVNFGCGTVTVNYDGIVKSRCEIGDNCFIGCNTNLIAPVKLGKAVYTAAGTTVTRDVPDYSLAIDRGVMQVKEGYTLRKLKGKL